MLIILAYLERIKKNLFLWNQWATIIVLWEFSPTSMLVTDIGDKVLLWKYEDFGDRSLWWQLKDVIMLMVLSPTSVNCHKLWVTNMITMSPASLRHFEQLYGFFWKMDSSFRIYILNQVNSFIACCCCWQNWNIWYASIDKLKVYRLSTKVPGSNGDETKSPIKCPISCPQKLWPEIQISRIGGIDLIVICFRGQLGPVKISKKKLIFSTGIYLGILRMIC